MQTLVFPPGLYGHEIFSRRLTTLQPQPLDEEVTLDLSQATFVRPDGIAHLIALVFTLLRRRYRLSAARPRNDDTHTYLCRSGFWTLLRDCNIGVPDAWLGFNRGRAPSLLECSRVEILDDQKANLDRTSLLADQLIRTLTTAGIDPSAIRRLFRLFIEIGNNAAEHSRSEHGAFIVAQAYRKTAEIEIAVVDVGRGIRSALHVAHPFDNDFDAVRAALHDEITGRLDFAGKPTHAGGTGLMSARCEASSLAVRSGSAVFQGGLPSTSAPRGNAPLAMHGTRCPALDGTIVTAIVRKHA